MGSGRMRVEWEDYGRGCAVGVSADMGMGVVMIVVVVVGACVSTCVMRELEC